MRIRRLDLMRHGHFTDRRLDFEPRPLDLHVIHGANEAGKSTARCAIADFLFGFDARSPHGFRHDYRQLLVGAVLESTGPRFEARRRKGNKDTLVGEDGSALEGAEARLGQLLGGIDRAGFERMFSLDQQRLRAGGDEMVREQGHAARTLFAASAGLGTLRTTIDALDREADGLWGPRRAAHRRFTAAHDRLQDAQRRVREQTLLTSRWQELRDAVDAALRRLEALEAAIAQAETGRRRLSRVRRVRNTVLRLDSATAERAALGSVPALPADARAVLEAAVGGVRSVEAALLEIDADVAARTARLAALQLDAPVLEREAAIGGLLERRGALVKARGDLPNLRRQLAQLHEAMRLRARELGWAEADLPTLAARAPSRADVAEARDLLERRSAWTESRRATLRTLEDTEEELAKLRRERAALGPVEDLVALEGRLSAARRAGDPDERIDGLARGVAEQQRRLERSLRELRPPVASVEDWLALDVPTPGAVQAAADAADALQREIEAEQRALATAEADLERSRAELERANPRADRVSLEAVDAARAHRDAGWRLVEGQHIAGPAPDPDELARYAGGAPAGLVAAYRAAVENADALADRRFDGAEAAGRIAELDRAVQARAAGLRRLLDGAARLQQRAQRERTEWLALWQPTGILPLAPAAMATWLQARAQAREAVDAIDSAIAQRDAERAVRDELRSGLVGALRALGVAVDPLAGETLRPVVEAAQAWLVEAGRRNATRERLDGQCAQAEAVAARRTATLRDLDATGTAWAGLWEPLAARLGLAGDAASAASATSTLRARLAILDEFREDAAQAEALRIERIGKIERDIEQFATEVGQLAGTLESGSPALEPEDAIARLGQRLRAAQDARRQHDALQAEADAQARRRTQRERERAEHAARIATLAALAGAGDEGGLADAVARAERCRQLELEIRDARSELAQQGDGLTEQELARECAGVDLDAAAVNEQAAEQRLAELRKEHAAARDALATAERQLADATGGADASEPHAALNAAAAELRGIAEAYLRASTARQLLRWALERYRRAQQGPLLKRAGALFATLSCGSFEGLEIGYDAADEARVRARRSGADAVDVEGLSEGTRDQLFLALRIASVEQRLAASTEAMPFVADDLFVNFDDDRTRAGLRVLAGLARHTQVLVFTHHSRLVELARAETGDALGVVEL